MRRLVPRWAPAAILGLSLATVGAAGPVSPGGGPTALPVSADVRLVSAVEAPNDPSASYGADGTLYVAGPNATWERRALLRWDLSGVSGVNSVEAVCLVLTVKDADPGLSIGVHTVSTAWDEATASWTSPAPGSGWQSGGGGDFGQELAAFSPTTGSPARVCLGTAGALDVAQWLADPTTNHGFLLKSNGSGGASFYASEESMVSRRPALEIQHDGGRSSRSAKGAPTRARRIPPSPTGRILRRSTSRTRSWRSPTGRGPPGMGHPVRPSRCCASISRRSPRRPR